MLQYAIRVHSILEISRAEQVVVQQPSSWVLATFLEFIQRFEYFFRLLLDSEAFKKQFKEYSMVFE